MKTCKEQAFLALSGRDSSYCSKDLKGCHWVVDLRIVGVFSPVINVFLGVWGDCLGLPLCLMMVS